MKWEKFKRGFDYEIGIYAVRMDTGRREIYRCKPQNLFLPIEYVCKIDDDIIFSKIEEPDEELKMPEGWDIIDDRCSSDHRLCGVLSDKASFISVGLDSRKDCVRFLNAGFKALEKKG